jgi:hypothetical protein
LVGAVLARSGSADDWQGNLGGLALELCRRDPALVPVDTEWTSYVRQVEQALREHVAAGGGLSTEEHTMHNDDELWAVVAEITGPEGLGSNFLPTDRGAGERTNGVWDVEALASEAVRRNPDLRRDDEAWSAFVKRLRKLLVERNLLRQAGGVDEPVALNESAARKSGAGLSHTADREFRHWLNSLGPGVGLSANDLDTQRHYTRLVNTVGEGRARLLIDYLCGRRGAALSLEGTPGAAPGELSPERVESIISEQLAGYPEAIRRRRAPQ